MKLEKKKAGEVDEKAKKLAGDADSAVKLGFGRRAR